MEDGMLIVASLALVGLVITFWMVFGKTTIADLNLQILRRASVVAGLVAVSLGSTSGHAATIPEADIVCPPGVPKCTEEDKEWSRSKIRAKCGAAGGRGILRCVTNNRTGETSVSIRDIQCGNVFYAE